MGHELWPLGSTMIKPSDESGWCMVTEDRLGFAWQVEWFDLLHVTNPSHGRISYWSAWRKVVFHYISILLAPSSQGFTRAKHHSTICRGIRARSSDEVQASDDDAEEEVGVDSFFTIFNTALAGFKCEKACNEHWKSFMVTYHDPGSFLTLITYIDSP